MTDDMSTEDRLESAARLLAARSKKLEDMESKVRDLDIKLARLEAFATGVVLSLTKGERCHDLLVVIESIVDDAEGKR